MPNISKRLFFHIISVIHSCAYCSCLCQVVYTCVPQSNSISSNVTLIPFITDGHQCVRYHIINNNIAQQIESQTLHFENDLVSKFFKFICVQLVVSTFCKILEYG